MFDEDFEQDYQAEDVNQIFDVKSRRDLRNRIDGHLEKKQLMSELDDYSDCLDGNMSFYDDDPISQYYSGGYEE